MNFGMRFTDVSGFTTSGAQSPSVGPRRLLRLSKSTTARPTRYSMELAIRDTRLVAELGNCSLGHLALGIEIVPLGEFQESTVRRQGFPADLHALELDREVEVAECD